MSLFVTKRTLKTGINEFDVLVPLYQSDCERLRKLKENRPIEITIKIVRDAERLRQYWALVSFYIYNLPEHRHEELLEAVTANNREYVSEWLKYTVGYVESFKVNGVVREYPKALNFYDKKNEDEVEKSFYEPVKNFLARDMGFASPYDLVHASLEYRKNK